MKAAVVTRAKEPITIEERPVPVPKAGEVLIRVKACGLCRGDLSLQQGGFSLYRHRKISGHSRP